MDLPPPPAMTQIAKGFPVPSIIELSQRPIVEEKDQGQEPERERSVLPQVSVNGQLCSPGHFEELQAVQQPNGTVKIVEGCSKETLEEHLEEKYPRGNH